MSRLRELINIQMKETGAPFDEAADEMEVLLMNSAEKICDLMDAVHRYPNEVFGIEMKNALEALEKKLGE